MHYEVVFFVIKFFGQFLLVYTSFEMFRTVTFAYKTEIQAALICSDMLHFAC